MKLTSKKTVQFFMKCLSDLVPYEPAEYLKVSFILFYIITQVIHGFWLVLAYDLLEDRRTIDVTISFYANKV